MSGWFALRRGWMDSFKPEPFTEREAFLWSIEQAAFADHEQWFNGHRIAVRRGEFVTSIRQMAKAFGWTDKRIRGLMERFSKAEKWAQRQAYDGAQSPTVISVCNYQFYQDPDTLTGTVEGTVKGKRGAQRGHSKGTQHNKGNKGTRIEEEDSPTGSSAQPTPAPANDGPNLLPAVDETSEALRRHQALRVELDPRARPLQPNQARRKAMAAALVRVGGLGGWDEVLATIRGSPFLRGEVGRFPAAGAPIDWLLKPANLCKLLEGNYDDRARSSVQHSGAVVPGSTIDALRAARAAAGFGRPDV